MNHDNRSMSLEAAETLRQLADELAAGSAHVLRADRVELHSNGTYDICSRYAARGGSELQLVVQANPRFERAGVDGLERTIASLLTAMLPYRPHADAVERAMLSAAECLSKSPVYDVLRDVLSNR